MREILFRGRDKDGNWHVGDLRHFRDKENPVSIIGEDGLFDVVPETVGEYTGHEDRNNVPIFEGDVVEGRKCTGIWVGTIIWISEIASFGIKWTHGEDHRTSWANSSILMDINRSAIDEFTAKVIGNIFDNPELQKLKYGPND